MNQIDEMNHEEARALLEDLETGNLDRRIRSSLTGHVDDCSTCQRWLESYRLLKRAMTGSAAAEEWHPDSELLALWAVQPEELDFDRVPDLRAHLGACQSCRREAELVRAAVTDGRPLTPHDTATNESSTIISGLWKMLAAAALAALLLGAGAWLVPRLAGPPGSKLPERTAGELLSPMATTTPSRRHLSGMELTGTQVIDGGETLTLADVRIGSGADVILRSKHRIALGDGVQIGPNARLTIETTSKTTHEEKTHD